MSTSGHGPQSPAKQGAKISGIPTQSVVSQGELRGNATCDRSQRLSLGPLERTATGDITVFGPSTAAQSTRGATPCVGGPPPTVPLGPRVPLGPSPKKQAKACKVARTSTQLEPSTSLQPPDPPSRTPEAILVLRRDLCLRNPRLRHLESPRGEEMLLAGYSEEAASG